MNIGRFEGIEAIETNIFDTEAVELSFENMNDYSVMKALENYIYGAIARYDLDEPGICYYVRIERDEAWACVWIHNAYETDDDENPCRVPIALTDLERDAMLDIVAACYERVLFSELGTEDD